MENKKLCRIKKIHWFIGYDKDYNVKVIPYIYNKDHSCIKILTTQEIIKVENNYFFWFPSFDCKKIPYVKKMDIVIIGLSQYLSVIYQSKFLGKEKAYEIYHIKDGDKIITQEEVLEIVDKAEKFVNKHFKTEIQVIKDRDYASQIEENIQNF